MAGVLVAGLVVTPACANRPESAAAVGEAGPLDELGRIRAAVEQALTAGPPRGYAAVPRGVRLLSVAADGEGAIVLNLSGELLASSARVLEDSLHQILTAAAAARETRPDRVDEFRVLINGVTLESYPP